MKNVYHSSNSSNEKYIQRSVVPTYHFQPSLPRLPIPKLEDTCRRYLDAQKVILSPEDYENTKRLVENFKQYEGPGKTGHFACRKILIFTINTINSNTITIITTATTIYTRHHHCCHYCHHHNHNHQYHHQHNQQVHHQHHHHSLHHH